MARQQSNLAYLLALSPLLLTILLALMVNSASASAGHSPRANKRHAAIIKARQEALDVRSVPPVSLPRRVINLGKRADGGACKSRSVTSSSAVATSTSAVVQAAVQTTSSENVQQSSSSEQPAETVTSSVYVATSTYESSSSSLASPAIKTANKKVAASSSVVDSVTSTVDAVTSEVAHYVAPTSTTQTTLATAGPVPSNSPDSCRKAGLAWPNGGSNQPAVWAKAMGDSWYYTWSPWSVDALSDLEFVPMLWGWKQVSDWQNNIQSYTSLGVKHALFVNEPNGSGQANMAVSSGCDLWFQQFEQLRSIVSGIKLGSAAPDGAPSGKQWLVDFTNNCASAKPDFIALHWYDVTYENFQDHVKDFAATWPDLDLWVTEYACQNFNGGAQCDSSYIAGDFFEQSTGWMNSYDRVARYSIFGVMEDLQGVNTANSLMASDGSPSSLGWKYSQSY